MNRVIDMWAPFLPLPEVSAHLAEHFPEPMLGYLKDQTDSFSGGFFVFSVA